MQRAGQRLGGLGKDQGVWAKIEKVGKECIFEGKGVISLGKEKLMMEGGVGGGGSGNVGKTAWSPSLIGLVSKIKQAVTPLMWQLLLAPYIENFS